MSFQTPVLLMKLNHLMPSHHLHWIRKLDITLDFPIKRFSDRHRERLYDLYLGYKLETLDAAYEAIGIHFPSLKHLSVTQMTPSRIEHAYLRATALERLRGDFLVPLPQVHTLYLHNLVLPMDKFMKRFGDRVNNCQLLLPRDEFLLTSAYVEYGDWSIPIEEDDEGVEHVWREVFLDSGMSAAYKIMSLPT
jgi:hypothetical protein